MDAKDLRTETTIGERSNNGSSKFAQGGAATANIASKPYDSISANPLAKLETPTSRPCAVIGPDRIVPPSNVHDAYSKKSHYEPWLNVDNTYRQPPEYPHKLPSYQSPIRNISPRQTFQENMQRIMVQPTYNSVKLNEDTSYTAKSSKIPGSHEPKYCDVPYTVNPISSDQKPNEMCVNNMNSSQNYPQMWHPGSVGVRPTRPYGAPELYQFPEYTGCAAPRPMLMPRPHRTMNEDPGHPYSETYYPEGNIRFKPYPTIKERYPQARYEYLSHYGNTFHPPPPFPTHKYDVQKPLPPHITYPQVPMKYLDNRMSDTVMDGYQRPQTVNYNLPYRNQVMHPAYGPMIGSNIPNKVYPYPPDGSVKSLAPNKLPYDSKLYADYENARNKGYPMPDSVYLNEMVRPHMKNPPVLPNYPNANMQPFHAHPLYRKENLAHKSYEYMSHLRHLDPSLNPNALSRLPTQFSPSAIAISPSDSNTSNETSQTHGGSLEDCGYVSQSSTASIRSYDSVNRMIPNDFHQRYNYPYQSMVRTSPSASKPGGNNTCNASNEKKNIDVRQFLQMWNEGEDENGSKEKEIVSQSDFNPTKLANQYDTMKANEQLYVLGLVNVPSEELGKYEHIQKISKLPENIKGYNNIELLKHFEEAIESSNINNSNHKPPTPRNYYPSMKSPLVHGTGLFPPRPLSPLDVEAKISQSVIHKEVGCNFEIKPCSPEMLNAEVATTAQSILGDERVIEKISNPIIIKSPKLSNTAKRENMCDSMNNKEHNIMLKEDVNKNASCKMINTQCSNNDDVNVVKSNYSIQDLESNAGVCLASLPRLDNELELNFPEVNQQFINANKESVIITNDFTTEIDSLPDNNTYKMNENVLPKSDSTTFAIPTLDIETEVSKLSKFRKVKRNELDYKEKQFVTASQSLRTDSVIIKNPENVKSFEKNAVAPTFEKKLNESQSVSHDSNHSSVNPPENNHDQISSPVNPPENNEITLNHADDSIEMAIDFSLNRLDTNTISENSKDLCKIAKNPVVLSEKLLYQQLPERGNTVCSLPPLSTNDIIKHSPVPDDEVKDINMMHHACERPKKSRSPIRIENPDIKECNVAPQQSVIDVEYSENCSKHLASEIADKESECFNIIREISVNDMVTTDSKNLKETTEFENHNKSIIKESTTYSIDNIIDKEAEHPSLLFCKTPIDHKIRKPDTTSNIKNQKVMYSSDSICCNFIEENYKLPPVNCNLTTVDIDASKKCLNYLKEEVTRNNTIEFDVTDSPMTPETVESMVSSTKKVSLRKELFSPQIQNLILWSEGNCLIIFSENGSKISSHSNVRHSRTTVLNTYRDSDKCEVQSKFDDLKDDTAVDDDPYVENITSEIKPQSESTDEVQYYDHDSEAKAPVKDELVNFIDDTSNKSQSGSTNSDGHIPESVTKICTDQSNPDTNIECITVPNPDAAVSIEDDFISVEEFSNNNKSQSQSKNIKIFSASTSKNSLHEDYTNNYCKLGKTDIVNCQISGSDNNVSSANVGVRSEFQSTYYIEISQACPTTDLEEKNSDENNTNKMLQSPYASDFTNDKTYPNLESDMESTVVNQSHNIKIDVDKSENESNDCSTLDSNIFQTDKESLHSETDCMISEPQPEPETLISNSYIDTSAADKLNNAIKSASVTGQLELNTDKNNEIFDLHEKKPDLGPNSANQVDGADSVCHTISNYDETCSISGTNQPISTAESSGLVRESANCELQSETTYVKDSVLSNSLEDSNEIKSSIVKKGQSESKKKTDSPIPTTDVKIYPETAFVVDNLNNATVDTNVERKSESKEIEPYPIPKLDLNKNFDKCQTLLEFDCVKNEFIHKIGNFHSKSSNQIESSQIVDCERDIKLGNIQKEICSSTESKTFSKNHDCETNIAIGDDFNVIDHIADDSGMHSQNESINLEKQVIYCDEILGEELNTNRPLIIHRGLKRSLSDSALNSNNYRPHDGLQEYDDIHNLVALKKRRKYNNFLNIDHPQCSTTDMLNVHINRRNSISSIYNDENMSLCIVIDNNCIITEENEEGEKLCYTEIPEACLTGMRPDNFEENSEIVICPQENNEYEDPFVLEISDGKSLEESWVDDVACVETVVSDDIAEDIELSAPTSPAEIYEEENDESGIFASVSEHTEKVKYIYGDKMCNDDAELVETLYRTPQMDVNKTLINRESHVTDDDDDDDDEFHRENIVNSVCPETHDQKTKYNNALNNVNDTVYKKNSFTEFGDETLIEKKRQGGADNLSSLLSQDTSNNPTESLGEPLCLLVCDNKNSNTKNKTSNTDSLLYESSETPQDNTINSCESSVDNVFSYNQDENVTDCPVFSSPEVSSTTSEEKNTSLLLKITNHQGTRTSQLNDTKLSKKNSCKFTENINYTNFISNSSEPRPLITKAAQKYIPPLKETVNDLKVKLHLPRDSLIKFKQLKIAKTVVRHSAVPKKEIPKKIKPKFEDVLKSIDEIQFKKHKEKGKKQKKTVPKVVIKKTENGSHYASKPNSDCYNPDLTGRKWQPWVFIEKNSFIDKMALRRKTKAVYNHRNNTYVFADKFKKYKSMQSAKFVITQPKLDNNSSGGQLKYTIRLKHS